MKYYFVRHSLSIEVGKYPQVVKAEYPCDVYDENFIDRVFFKKAKFEPLTAKAIIVRGAKKTDLISASIVGFSLKHLVSTRLKDLILKYRCEGVEFFNSPILFKGEEDPQYWIMSAYGIDWDTINWSKSNCVLRKRKEGGGTFLEPIRIDSTSEFIEKQMIHRKLREGLMIDKLNFKKNVSSDILFINYLKNGGHFIVSQNFKNEVKGMNITGIEFMPLDIPYHEWMKSGGPREQEYGMV